jgi:membrane protein DedA with SNARE-associated domain
MECLPINETFSSWLIQYGSFVLFFLLLLGIIAFPIPDETLMVFAGVLIDDGKLYMIPTLIAAYAGSICGITLSYIVGRTVGHYFIHKYGSWVGITVERLAKAEAWFQKYGKWTLTFGYFIPGIRHFTGLASGMANVPYKDFALFAYSGAILWATTFLLVGFFFGNYCLAIFDNIEIGIEDFVIVAAIVVIIYLLIHFKKNRQNKINN